MTKNNQCKNLIELNKASPWNGFGDFRKNRSVTRRWCPMLSYNKGLESYDTWNSEPWAGILSQTQKPWSLLNIELKIFCVILTNWCIEHYKKMKFFIKDFFNKCDQIRRKLQVLLHLLKKSLMETSVFVQWRNNLALIFKCQFVSINSKILLNISFLKVLTYW